ncbi:32670_t:CDS:2, partial [Racocetra persica]
ITEFRFQNEARKKVTFNTLNVTAEIPLVKYAVAFGKFVPLLNLEKCYITNRDVKSPVRFQKS